MKNNKKILAPSIAEWEEDIIDDEEQDLAKLAATGTSTNLEMSVEETNKLRAQLGLKPLEIDDGTKLGEKKDFTHQPAINISEIESQEKIREKLKLMKSKRETLEKFNKMKTISEQISDKELEDTTSWIERMRQMQNLNKIESVNDLKLNNNDIKKHKTDGLLIAHKLDEFEQNMNNEETILILKDSNVLDNEDDILENPQLNEIRNAKKNISNRSAQSDYNPYGGDEEDFEMDYKDSILSKYNQEIEKPKIPMMRIGEEGKLTIDGQMASISEKLQQKYGTKAISLNDEKMLSLNDYMTPEEVIKVKQRKRKPKTRIKNNIKMEDQSMEEIIEFHKRNLIHNDKISENIDTEYDELETILSKSRLRIQKYEPKLTDIADKIYETVINDEIENNVEMKSDNEEQKQLVLDDIGEFVRSHTTQETTQNKIIIDTYSDASENEIEMDTEDLSNLQNQEKTENFTQLIQEPVLGKGLAATLDFARSKGYVQENKKVYKTYKSNLPESEAVIDYERTKGLHSRRLNERSGNYNNGSIYRGNFPELEDYDPEIKLENVDKDGNILSVKEAFRVISHKFHGNRPGKMKQYKRKRKVQKNKADEISSIGINNTDKTLKLLEVMSQKQKQLKTPYLVLSGSAKASIVNGPNKLSKK